MTRASCPRCGSTTTGWEEDHEAGPTLVCIVCAERWWPPPPPRPAIDAEALGLRARRGRPPRATEEQLALAEQLLLLGWERARVARAAGVHYNQVYSVWKRLRRAGRIDAPV